VVAGVVGAVILVTLYGRRKFLQLEVVDGYGEVQLVPRITTPSATRRRSHPAALLVKKELRLHLLAVAVAALYSGGWIAMRLARFDLQIAGQSFEVITGMYSAFIAVLVGATASAEERAMGMTASQTLQPYAFWRQWTVKVTVTVAVAIVLGPVLAAALEAGFPLIGDSGNAYMAPSRLNLPRIWLRFFGASSAVLAILSLHVSTLSSGALRALMLTLPYCFVLGSLYTSLSYQTYELLDGWLRDPTLEGPFWWQVTRLRGFPRTAISWSMSIERWLGPLALVGLLATALTFGFRNHRSAEHSRVATRQLLSMVLYTVAAGILVTVVLWYLATN
jgi:hypothetical protein